jgi:hypothetical protein
MPEFLLLSVLKTEIVWVEGGVAVGIITAVSFSSSGSRESGRRSFRRI